VSDAPRIAPGTPALDLILWQSVHGANRTPRSPRPNDATTDEQTTDETGNGVVGGHAALCEECEAHASDELRVLRPELHCSADGQ
jgi:hypothetical protein